MGKGGQEEDSLVLCRHKGELNATLRLIYHSKKGIIYILLPLHMIST